MLAVALLATTLFAQTPLIQDPPQWTLDSTYAAGGLVRASNGAYYRSIKSSKGHDPVADGHIYWELYYVRSNLILTVATGGVFPNFKQAWASISGATIAGQASVTISINGGNSGYTEICSAPISLNHPNGSQITIAGSHGVTFDFSAARSSGLTVTGSHTLGGLTGMVIQGAQSGNGLYVNERSSVLNANIVVHGFNEGMLADNHSYLNCTSSTVTGGLDSGVFADRHSEILCRNVYVNGTNSGHIAIQADFGSTIDAQHATVSSTVGFGVTADHASTVDAAYVGATDTSTGFGSFHGSQIRAFQSTSSMQEFGFFANYGGQIEAVEATVTGNQIDFHPAPNAASADLAYIVH